MIRTTMNVYSIQILSVYFISVIIIETPNLAATKPTIEKRYLFIKATFFSI